MALLSEIIKELRDFFGAVRDAEAEGDANRIRSVINQKENSIKSKAKDSIMKFPLLVSTSLKKESITMIMKALEVEYANLIRLAISMDDIVDADQVRDAASKVRYLQKFHKNITPSAVMDDAISDSTLDGIIKKTLKPDNGLNKKSLNESTIHNDHKDHIFLEARGNSTSTTPSNINASNQATIAVSAQEIKKVNDMTPTLLDLTLQYKTGEQLRETKLLIGIKTYVHPISGNEMEYYVGRSLKEENFFFRLIQWTTGEISFFKDFLLNVDRIKDDAMANNNVSSPWWNKLKGMANASLMLSFFQRTKLIPTSTLILSMEEVDRLKYSQGVDILNRGQAAKLSKIFFLLGLVIIDEVDEIVYIFDEETKTYANHSFAALSKESKDSSSLKAILSMFGKQ
jgi:hypothetical protein